MTSRYDLSSGLDLDTSYASLPGTSGIPVTQNSTPLKARIQNQNLGGMFTITLRIKLGSQLYCFQDVTLRDGYMNFCTITSLYAMSLNDWAKQNSTYHIHGSIPID
jgi:hypothetical protein